jgi:regulator of protease activity HflC (stomatin/prohibitin superfamily)
MSIKNAAVSSVLALMFLSLLVIYTISLPSPLITFLSVLIMLVGLIMAQSSSWRDIGILAAVAVVVSMVAIALLARPRLGTVGTVFALLLWGLILFALFSSARRTIRPLPRDQAILIQNKFTGIVHTADGPIVTPNIPFMESVVAVIPLYELSTDVKVEKVNTQRQNVDVIEVHILYKVKDPHSALVRIPNLGQAQNAVALEMKQDVNDARLQIGFWENLLNRQMHMDTDDVVRSIVYDNRFAQNPIEVSSKRRDLADDTLDRLRKVVGRWGAEVIDLEFERVDVNPDVIKSINKAGIREEDTLVKKIEAERDATRIDLVLAAEVNAEAERVRAIIQALKDSGVEITPDLVVKAISATSDWQMEGDFSLLTQQPPPLPVAPAPAKPPEKPAEKK